MVYPVASLVLALTAASPATSETPKVVSEPAWSEEAEVATATRASIGVPPKAGTMSRMQVRDLGQDGIDLAAQYASPDEQIFGTIFIYKPTLPDSGLTFLATDEAIRRRLGETASSIEDQPIAVGGVAKAGRRVIYSSNDRQLGSSALLVIQAGNWMLKLRVSGPADRTQEIATNLDALAAGLKFGKGSEPLPTHIIQTGPCEPSSPVSDAKLVKPQKAAAIAQTIMAVPNFVDKNGHAVADPTDRVPDRLCLAESTSDGKIPLLTYRTVTANADSMFKPSIFQLYGDAGHMIEVTRAGKGVGESYALRHSIGRVIVYGGFATEPSAVQFELMRRSSDQLPVVATIKSHGGGTNTELYCNSFAEGCSAQE